MLINYVLVAVGGAIGSMLRAWGTIVVQGLTGAALPWGTIAINVIGSFVIGFFATLTAGDGRFAAAHDLRTFVMVGLCGGFTTFSSFSLQTLELLREGRPGAALGNVGLSVGVCLLAVAAGYAAAIALRGAPVGVSIAARDRHMVVAIVAPASIDTGVLAYARRLAPLQGGRLTLIAIQDRRRDAQPTQDVPAAGGRAGWMAGAQPQLDRWLQACREDGLQVRLLTTPGNGAINLLEHGRGAALVLIDADEARAHPRLMRVAARARRPVLVVPTSAGPPDATQMDPRGARLAAALAGPLGTELGIGRTTLAAWRRASQDGPVDRAILVSPG